MIEKIRTWLFGRYVATLPPFVSRTPEMIDEYFQKHHGRRFRPWNASDRVEFRRALSGAMLANLHILFKGFQS